MRAVAAVRLGEVAPVPAGLSAPCRSCGLTHVTDGGESGPVVNEMHGNWPTGYAAWNLPCTACGGSVLVVSGVRVVA